MSTCALKALLFALTIANWQSQCIDIESFGLVPNGISNNKFLIHLASLLVSLEPQILTLWWI